MVSDENSPAVESKYDRPQSHFENYIFYNYDNAMGIEDG